MPVEDLEDLITRFEADPERTTARWRIANASARVGDRVYLFKQGDGPCGIFGFGEIVDAPARMKTPSDPDIRLRADVRFETLVDPSKGFLLPLHEMDDIAPKKEWEDLVRAEASGTFVKEEIAAQIESKLAFWWRPALESPQADDDAFDLDSISDARERAFRAICIRRGQLEFRARLLSAYNGRCVITGCAVGDVLEAAHIFPYRGSHTNQTSNGLLLRADVHTLFDCNLVAVDPDTRQVVIASSLSGSSYAALAGRAIRRPKREEDAPSRENLRRRFSLFRENLKL